MPDKVLDADYINNLLNPKKRKLVTKQTEVERIANINTDDDPRGFDVLRVVQTGYPHPGDKGDIWSQWVKQNRTGAEELISRWG